MVGSKIKIVTFRSISYRDGTNNSCASKLYTKMPHEERRRYHISIGLELSKDEGQSKVKCKGQCKVKYGHRMKMPHKYRVTRLMGLLGCRI